MMSLIASLFPTVAGWINDIIGYFQARQQARSAQDTAVDQALASHSSDGAQSVADQTSSDAQNASLDQQLHAIDNPTPVTVVVNKSGDK